MKTTAKCMGLLVGLAMYCGGAMAQHSTAETKEDIARHRAMAAAHEAAAKCLESGKAEKQCLADLQTTCKGLAIGKYCGLRHAH